MKSNVKQKIPFVDIELARRMELTSAYRAVEYAGAYTAAQEQAGASGTSTAVLPVAGGYAVATGPSLPVNRAVGLGMNGPVTSQDLKIIIEFFRTRGLPARFDLCPLADPSLVELAAGEGFVVEGFLNMLFCRLTDRHLSLPMNPEVRVTHIGPGQDELWLRTVSQGFAEEEKDPPAGMVEIISHNLRSAAAHAYLAWVGGEPAGGGTMVEHDQAVELGSASTRLPFRRMGVQTALVNARLADARSRGCDLAILLTEPGSASQRNAQRLGFDLAYTRLRMVHAESLH